MSATKYIIRRLTLVIFSTNQLLDLIEVFMNKFLIKQYCKTTALKIVLPEKFKSNKTAMLTKFSRLSKLLELDHF